MHHAPGTPVGILRAEEEQVAGLQVGEVAGNLDVLAHQRLLRCIARYDDVVQVEDCAHKPAAIHSLWRCAAPHVGDAHQRVGGVQYGGGIPRHFPSPPAQLHGILLADEARAAIGETHFDESPSGSQVSQPVASHSIAHVGRLGGWFLVNPCCECRDNGLLGLVPFGQLLTAHALQGRCQRPVLVALGRSDVCPFVVPAQYLHGHSHHRLRFLACTIGGFGACVAG